MDTRSVTSGNGAAGRHSARSFKNLKENQFERLRSMLASIDPNDHDTWLRVGMGIKDEFGEDGWSVFDEWSRPAANYNHKENYTRWRSFKSGGGITIATVSAMAGANGWQDDGTVRALSIEDMAAREKARAKAKADAAEKHQVKAAKAARNALAVWLKAEPAKPVHQYATDKSIVPTETLREIDVADAKKIIGHAPKSKNGLLEGRCIVVPVKRDDKLSSIQLIDDAGRKYFLTNGVLDGGYWAAQRLPDGDGAGVRILIGEGVATVLSAKHAMPSALGVAAMMNGNTPAVARQMRGRYPKADIVFLADINKKSGEPDRLAVEAAEAVGGRVAMPRFKDGPAPDRKDFNDLARLYGPEAVRGAIKAAEVPHPLECGTSTTGHSTKPRVNLISAGTIKPEPISWLWDGHLARGKLHILGGKPAAGKTSLAIAIAAIVTTGGIWPDGTKCQPGNVIIWSGEDDPADTLVPRLIAAGADLNRVHFVADVIVGNEKVPFDPAKHMQALAETLLSLDNVALLIVDPVVSAVAGDSYKNAEVRRALQPLADLAASSNCAVFGITHLTKGTGGRDPVERLTGSLAFGALARVVLVATNVENDADDADGAIKPARLMMRAKSNIGPDGGGFAYDLTERELPGSTGIVTTKVSWGEVVYGSARELLAEAEANDSEKCDAVSDAADWLRDLLSKGPVEANQIKTSAKAAGHSWATVRRAKQRLTIMPTKQGMTGRWWWSLPRRCSPNSEDAPFKTGSTFHNLDHLRDGEVGDDMVEGTV